MNGPSSTPTSESVVLDGRYELTSLVGAGGVAEVWRARDRRLGRDVAVKILSGPAARDPGQRARVAREARALAAVAHPSVVSVFDYGEQRTNGENVPYLVMELVDGPDLSEELSQNGPMSAPAAVELVVRVLDGVQEAHSRGIVHGDLKPANVFLSPGGPKVGDFGVARILAEETGATALAATPTYAAPEVLEGARPTPAADVYSAACLLYEALTGRPPFSGDNMWEVARRHREETAPPPSVLRPDIPPEVDDAVALGLEKDPARRPATASHFADVLRSVVFPEDHSPDGHAVGIPAAVAPPTVPVRHDATEVLPPPPRRVLGGRTGRFVRRISPGLAIAVVAVAVLTGLAEAKVRVPELTGRPQAEALALAKKAGFQTEVVEKQLGGAAGTVRTQTPPAGSRLDRGETVTLTVTTGVPQVKVPEMIGMTTEAAEQTLRDHNLKPAVEYVRSGDPGHVVAADPPAGTSVDEGSTVTITVPQAPPPPPAENPRPEGGRGGDDDDKEDKEGEDGRGGDKGKGKGRD